MCCSYSVFLAFGFRFDASLRQSLDTREITPEGRKSTLTFLMTLVEGHPSSQSVPEILPAWYFPHSVFPLCFQYRYKCRRLISRFQISISEFLLISQYPRCRDFFFLFFTSSMSDTKLLPPGISVFRHKFHLLVASHFLLIITHVKPVLVRVLCLGELALEDLSFAGPVGSSLPEATVSYINMFS